jgi:hypothetical protein
MITSHSFFFNYTPPGIKVKNIEAFALPWHRATIPSVLSRHLGCTKGEAV